MQAALLLAFKAPVMPTPSSGPYALVASLLVCFLADVPSSGNFAVAGLALSDKVYPALAALQLALCGGIPASLGPSLAGALVGLAWRSSERLRRARVPGAIARPVAGLLGPWVAPAPPQPHPRAAAAAAAAAHAGPAGPLREGLRGDRDAGPAGAAASGGGAGAAYEPPSNLLDELEGMGFARGMAAEALRRTQGDTHAAVALLLDGP